LAAAQQLQAKGKQVLVLEGRDSTTKHRLGGRTWTNRSLQNLPLDLGAFWTHGIRNNPLTALATQSNIRTLPTDYESLTLYNGNGREISGDREQQTEDRLEELLAQLERERDKMADAKQQDISLQ
jgi:monoamine oxidase